MGATLAKLLNLLLTELVMDMNMDRIRIWIWIRMAGHAMAFNGMPWHAARMPWHANGYARMYMYTNAQELCGGMFDAILLIWGYVLNPIGF